MDRAMEQEAADDTCLVQETLAGHQASFQLLVERYQSRVYSLCLRWLGNEELADEIAQEVFLAAWRAIGDFREEARFASWIRRITVNRCKNARVSHTRRARDRHDPIVEEPEEEGQARVVVVSQAAPADASVDASRASVALQRALSALREDQRAIIVLRDMEDLDYDEIASLLDVPRGTVKSRLHRARTALAAALSPYLGPKDVL